MFDLAPHLSADKDAAFAFHNDEVGRYFSTAWYQLQMVINSGNRNAGDIAPVDNNYHPNHINGLTRHGGPAHPWRMVATYAKMLQQTDQGSEPLAGASLNQLHPARLFLMNETFEAVPPATWVMLLEGYLDGLMNHLEQFDESEWEREEEPCGKSGIAPADYAPTDRSGENLNTLHHQHCDADLWYTTIPTLRLLTVNEGVLDRMIDWGEEMWPLGDWDDLRL